jgi:hypothetical protein
MSFGSRLVIQQSREHLPRPLDVALVEHVDRAPNAYRGLRRQLTATVGRCTVIALVCTRVVPEASSIRGTFTRSPWRALCTADLGSWHSTN